MSRRLWIFTVRLNIGFLFIDCTFRLLVRLDVLLNCYCVFVSVVYIWIMEDCLDSDYVLFNEVGSKDAKFVPLRTCALCAQNCYREEAYVHFLDFDDRCRCNKKKDLSFLTCGIFLKFLQLAHVPSHVSSLHVLSSSTRAGVSTYDVFSQQWTQNISYSFSS